MSVSMQLCAKTWILSAQFAREGLRVRQSDRPFRRMADVRDDDPAVRTAGVDDGVEPRAVARRFGLAQHPSVEAVVAGYAPAVRQLAAGAPRLASCRIDNDKRVGAQLDTANSSHTTPPSRPRGA